MPTKKPKNHEMAREWLALPKNARDLLFVEGWDCFFRWTKDRYYQAVEEELLCREIWEFVQDRWPDVQITAGLVRDVYQQAKWGITRRIPEMLNSYTSFDDVMLDLVDFKRVAHSRENLAVHYVPFTLKSAEASGCPEWLKFLESSLVKRRPQEDDPSTPHVWETDHELIRIVQEMFGYYLMNSMAAATAFFLVGEGANGKSTMADVLTNMIGEKWTTAMSIETLTTRPFSTASLVGKKLNVCNEEESKYIRSDKFKALVTGDLIQAERKYGATFEFRPLTKYLFCTNEMPSFNGLNYGLTRRIKVIPFNRVFLPEERDTALRSKLLSEMPGIVGWAIEGARRLVAQRDVFSRSMATEGASADFLASSNSAIWYIKECWEPHPDYFITNKDIYAGYVEWCRDNGRKPMGSNNFLSDMSRFCPQYRHTSSRDPVSGAVVRGRRARKLTSPLPLQVGLFPPSDDTPLPIPIVPDKMMPDESVDTAAQFTEPEYGK